MKPAKAAFACMLLACIAPAQAAKFYEIEHMAAPAGIVQLIYAPGTHSLVMREGSSRIISVDLQTLQTVQRYPIGRFNDMSLSPSGRYVFAADYGGENIGYGSPLYQSYVHRLDLTGYAWASKLAYIAGQVQAVSDTQLILKSLDQWVTFTNNLWGGGLALTVLNSSTPPWAPGWYALVYSGDFRYDPVSGRLIHGNVGSSSQELTAFKLQGNNDFVTAETSGIYGSAQGYGYNVALATDSSAFYYGRLRVNPLDVRQNVRVFGDAIVAATGDVAFADGKYYDARNGDLLGLLGFSSTVYALNPSGTDFWVYDSTTSMLRRFAKRPFDGFAPRRDFNADGRQDIAFRNSTSGAIAMWQMNGLATVQASTLLTDPNWRVVHVADVNGDLRSDLVWRNTTTGAHALWLMNGTVATTAALLPAGPDWVVTHTGDFDDDGKADLLWRNTTTGETAIWLMDGVTVKSAAVVLSDANWRVTHVADFDGDGKSDLLWVNDTTGQAAIWNMNGKSVATAAVLIASPQWRVTHVADLNGDGKADLIWRNQVTGAIAGWLMDGVTASSAAILLYGGSWDLVLAADTNGDGMGDLVLQNSATGETVLWLMNGLASKGAVSLLKDPQWTVTHTADLDGDAKADLIWRNVVSGQIAGWLMDGTKVKSSAMLLNNANWTVSPAQVR